MWSRTAPRHTGSVVRRLSTIGGVLLAVTAATAGPASAAASNDITVALSPTKSTIMAVASPRTSATDRDATVGYGGSVTVQFPPQVTPGAGTVFGLDFYEPTNPSQGPLPGQQWYYSSAPGRSQPGGVPLTVSDLGGGAVRIDMPPVGAVDGLNNDHWAELHVDGLTTSLPGGTTSGPGTGFTALVYVSTAAPASASLSAHLRVVASLPRVGVTSPGTIRLTLPRSSALQQAGMTSLTGVDISWTQYNASNETWPVTTSVSADGHAATLRIAGGIEPGVYSVWVVLNRPDLSVEENFEVQLSAPAPAIAAPASTSAAAPVTTPAPTPSATQPAPVGIVAAPTAHAVLRPAASSNTAWLAWTGLGVAVVAVAGGAAFLVKRRRAPR